MFDKEKFAIIIRNINSIYENQSSFANASGVNRTYLSQYMNLKLDSPPTPKILKGIAENSKGVTSYEELMSVCGYSEETLESKVLSIYETLTKYQQQNNTKDSQDTIIDKVVTCIEYFQDYINYLDESLCFLNDTPILLEDILNFSNAVGDYIYISGFLVIYNNFIKLLETESLIVINNFKFINCFDIEELYNNLTELKDLELLSYGSENISIKNCNDLNTFNKYIKAFSRCLTLSHLSKFDNNALLDLFKEKASQSMCNESKIEKLSNNKEINTNKNNFNDHLFRVPILGKIAAGQPILAEEYIEGYLPVDPNIYGVSTAEDLFYLRIAGNSMNLKVKNGDYALIKKQDYAEDGDIVAVIVNSDDEATLKRYKKLNEQFVLLEPMSTDPNFEAITVDLKNTTFQIIGKAIGQFGKF